MTTHLPIDYRQFYSGLHGYIHEPMSYAHAATESCLEYLVWKCGDQIAMGNVNSGVVNVKTVSGHGYIWKCGDQMAMGNVNSGGPMLCEWKVTYQKVSGCG